MTFLRRLAFMRIPSSWQPNDNCSSALESEDDSFLKVSGKVFTPALYEPSQYFFLKAFSPWESPADDFGERSGHWFGAVTWPVTHFLSSCPVLPGGECLPSLFCAQARGHRPCGPSSRSSLASPRRRHNSALLSFPQNLLSPWQ